MGHAPYAWTPLVNHHLTAINRVLFQQKWERSAGAVLRRRPATTRSPATTASTVKTGTNDGSGAAAAGADVSNVAAKPVSKPAQMGASIPSCVRLWPSSN